MNRTGQFFMYGLIGVMATAVHYALMAWLLSQDWYPVSASTAGAFVGALVAYMANRQWTFPVRHSTVRMLRFMAVAALGLLMNAALLMTIHQLLFRSIIVAQLLTTAIVFVATFFINAHWSFAGKND